MRLATFNVLHGRDPGDGRVDVDRFAAAVAALDADVLALQEVDRAQPRSHLADLTRVAAQAGGYGAARFLPALQGTPDGWRRATGEVPADVPAYGVALLSRLPVTSWRDVRLPALPGRVPVVFPGTRRVEVVDDEPRVAVVARLQTPGGPLTVVSTHLSFLPLWNGVQLRLLARRVGRERPMVLMGDLNLAPDQVVRGTRLRPLAAGPTFPADAPVRQLDHLLGRGALTSDGGRVVRTALSDHRALVAEVQLL